MEHPENVSFRWEEIWCRNGEKKIYGKACIPETEEGRKPLVIFSHELGRSHRSGIPYAERLAEAGFATYTYDFCGGSVDEENRSDGQNLGMSMMTELTDLEAVTGTARGWDFIDPGRIFLIGASQGGVVSALMACRHPEETAGLVMMYPPLFAADGMRKMFGSPERIPETFDLFHGWIWVGGNYAADLWNVDFYAELSQYRKKALLLHGSRDKTVDPKHSVKAAAVMPDCEFHIIEGAGHSFRGECFEEAMGYILDYLKRILQNL